MIVTNHTYDVVGAYVPTKEMGGGSGLKYSASTIIYLGKKKEKDGTELIGNIIKCEAQEVSFDTRRIKVETRLYFDSRGLERHYGLLEMGERAGLWKILLDVMRLMERIVCKANPQRSRDLLHPQVLDELDKQAQKEFLYGVDDE